MDKWTLGTSAERLAFEDVYIPYNLVWHESDEKRTPLVSLLGGIVVGDYPKYTSFFLGAGLK